MAATALWGTVHLKYLWLTSKLKVEDELSFTCVTSTWFFESLKWFDALKYQHQPSSLQCIKKFTWEFKDDNSSKKNVVSNECCVCSRSWLWNKKVTATSWESLNLVLRHLTYTEKVWKYLRTYVFLLTFVGWMNHTVNQFLTEMLIFFFLIGMIKSNDTNFPVFKDLFIDSNLEAELLGAGINWGSLPHPWRSCYQHGVT